MKYIKLIAVLLAGFAAGSWVMVWHFNDVSRARYAKGAAQACGECAEAVDLCRKAAK